MLAVLRTMLSRKPDAPIADKRRSPREACNIAAWLFDDDGIAAAATILDRSAGGVRVTCEAKDFPARAIYILRADTGAAYRLRCAWYGPQMAGYEFKRRVDGRPNGRDHALDAVRVAAAECLAPRGRP